jgi:hypothetical protein
MIVNSIEISRRFDDVFACVTDPITSRPSTTHMHTSPEEAP